MAARSHTIGRQWVEASVTSEATALALRPVLAEINRRVFLPAIERVLDELDSPGRVVRLSLVEVDLGTLPLSRLAEAGVEALVAALREVLKDRMREAAEHPTPDDRHLTAAEARTSLLEHYLVHGTLPLWAGPSSSFAFEAMVVEAATADPGGLAALIRRVGRRRAVIERLVRQLADPVLTRLLHLLEPEHAALIVDYMVDLGELHRIKPVVALGRREFVRLAWVLTFGYLVRDPGSQFNRRSYVRWLLHEIADGEALDYADLLAVLIQALGETGRRRPVASSLPAVIRELAADLDAAGAAPADEEPFSPPSRLTILEDALLRPDSASGAAEAMDAQMQALIETDPVGLATLIRRHGRRAGLLEALVERVGDPTLRRILMLLQPEHAALIIAYMVDLREVHRAEGLLTLAAPEIGRLLWVLALSYVVRDPGSQFNRKSYVRALLEGMAEREGLDWRAMVGALAMGVAASERARGLSSSLPGVIAEIAREATAAGTAVQPGSRALRRYDHLEMLRYYLDHGVLPWSAVLRDPGLTPSRVLALLPNLSRALMGAVLARNHPDDRLRIVLRAMRDLPRPLGASLLLGLIPAPSQAMRETVARHDGDAVLLARAAVAALDGHSPDLDGLAAMPPPELFAGSTVAHAAKSAIAAALARQSPEWVAPFETLLSRHPAEARAFLAELAAAPAHRAALVSTCPPALALRVPTLARPADADLLVAVAELFAAVPPPDRPRDGRVRQVVLDVTLSLSAGRPLTAATLRRMIRELWGTAPPGAVTSFIGRMARTWAEDAGRLPPGRIALLSAALDQPESDAGAEAADGSPPDMAEAVLAFLGNRSPRGPRDAILHALHLLLERGDDKVLAAVATGMADRAVRRRWSRLLPESALVRMAAAAEPHRHERLLDAAEVMFAAWRAIDGSRASTTTHRAVFWETVLAFLAAEPAANRSVDRLAAFMLARPELLPGSAAPSSPEAAAAVRNALTEAKRLARAVGNVALLAALHRDAATAGKPTRPEPGPRHRPEPPVRGRTTFALDGNTESRADRIVHIDNAGLVLASPFVPHLFKELRMVKTEKDGAVHLRPKSLSRAVHLLQYLVDGRTATPEPLLVLNKFLCGVGAEVPVDAGIRASARERRLCETVLKSMIASWTILGDTSPESLRNTFMKRAGRLELSGGTWRLRVQRKTEDILVDAVPWPLSVLVHPWMPEPLYVIW